MTAHSILDIVDAKIRDASEAGRPATRSQIERWWADAAFEPHQTTIAEHLGDALQILKLADQDDELVTALTRRLDQALLLVRAAEYRHAKDGCPNSPVPCEDCADEGYTSAVFGSDQ